MSEINCWGDEIIYGEVIPGWFLVRLVNINVTPNKYMVNGDLMGEGHLGLTRLNDPSFIFAMDPIPWNKEWDKDIYPLQSNSEEDKYWKVYRHYRNRLKGSIEDCHNLAESIMKINNSTTYESIYAFLIDRMAEVIREGPTRKYRY
jgi:hypothetical protein